MKKNISKNDNQDIGEASISVIEQKENSHIENDNNEANQNLNEEKKEEEPLVKIELCIGTPHFTNVNDLKIELDDKTLKINKENIDLENYKQSLNSLLNELNKTISEIWKYYMGMRIPRRQKEKGKI